jgi:phosphopantothenoylcysteine decarboxylase / phosphopantothenate---cysteine ligase
MRLLLTAGPTHEPIDAVRYIANRSSGRMGAALAQSALNAGHQVTLILGPGVVPIPDGLRRIDVETADQMHRAVIDEFPRHDLLIMAAAVADFRPKTVRQDKVIRHGSFTIECESTPDILAEVGRLKQPHQRTIGFSLESDANLDRARQKLRAKNLDLIVHNPVSTLASPDITAVLIFAGGKEENLPSVSKTHMADILLQRAADLWK